MHLDLLPHIPVIVPLLFLGGSMFVVLGTLRTPRAAQPVACAIAGLATLFCAGGLAHVLTTGSVRYYLAGWVPPIGIELVYDPLSAFLTLVMCGVGFLVLLHARRVVPAEIPGREVAFYAVSLLLLGGLCGIVLTGDLFNLYVFIEIVSLSSYALLGIGSKRAPLSAFRYLVMGTTAGSFYLLGLALIYMRTGTLNMADLAAILPTVSGEIPIGVGVVFLLMGLALKSALFPLHGWLPDAYTDGSSTATALIAPIGTKSALYAMLRVVYFILGPAFAVDATPIADVIAYAGGAAIIWGSFMAMGQKELKRMLAYSSVAQVGYIALGIGLMSPYGFIGAVLHILNHACMKACLFLVSGNLRRVVGHSYLPNLDASVRREMPWSMAAFSVAAVSMIGLPPTAGFFSKWYLALGTVEQGRWLLLATLLVSTLMNAVYFVRIFEQVYLKPAREGGSGRSAAGEAPSSMLAPTVAFAVLLLVFGFGNVILVAHVLEPMLPGGLG
ncbi:MAG: complex I subunit 5 family protein [Planctomycetota bacterium]|jgi:multicomponent Na+:H+ antiporter subunit D